MPFPPFVRSAMPALSGGGVTLRPPRKRDHEEWARLRQDSRAFLEPWEPRWPADDLDYSAWRQRLRRYNAEAAAGTGHAFLIFENEKGRLVGGISVGNIRHGVAQSAQIGYWMGERYAGRGLMQAAMKLALSHAFDTLKLHRLEAACIPDNARSIRVLENAGFRREGLLRSYLRINGVWRDHLLYALIAEEHRARHERG
ncbi:GNAT family protein [Mesorhizobium sp. YIM 152430]|uniref:GNAT family N-acetyltransferase n=1 Tax=Mesorhizobium sp. YIM 152430 TaxID=3031761 RepID=UPI0023DC9364|nr:GNAT family protein [Mesorhizobium sp. YIM 152430]MDF1601229.1 GNAT family protein [Mesorhizobium sp. YIM 152430]